MTNKLYLSDHSLCGMSILTAVVAGEHPFVRLKETPFHPQGGGQRGDRGSIAWARVLDTRHGAEGEVDHFVDSTDRLTVGMEVAFAVDADHRRRGTLLHSAGHLIAEAGQIARPGLRAVAGHHWDGEARVEFEGIDAIDNQLKDDLETHIALLVTDDLPFMIVGDPLASRAVRIGSFDPVPCGGTHLRSTCELASLAISGTKMKSGRLRVSYTV